MGKPRNPMGKGGFKPGQSGNPGGRPKQFTEVLELLRDDSQASIDRLKYLREHGKPDSVQAYCANALLDRAWGRPAQAVLQAGSTHSAAFVEFLESINGESRRLPPGNEKFGGDEYPKTDDAPGND
ncbi:MAG: hypothetical protein JO289_24975 [Xanthobacteraceae bacterium]|nr:hypothetical protein [Xanthobacteraceae bacterium]